MDRPRVAAFLLVFIAFPARWAAAQEPRPRLAYEVDATRPESGAVGVTLTVSGASTDPVRLAMPAWAPGAYRVVDYAGSVRNLRAGDPPHAAVKVDGSTWEVRAGSSDAFTVSYELAVDRNRMDAGHCFLAGPDTYLYLAGRCDTPCRVRFRLPEGWKVGTALEKDGDGYAAHDYDTFIDCPVELGRFETLTFSAGGADYDLVVHSAGAVDGARLVETARKIVTEENAVFGGPPFRRYVFLYHFLPVTAGIGLEYLTSTNINLPYGAVRLSALSAAPMTSHEYFHVWNVKRLRPAELESFDYSKPVRTKALWFCEGVTSYYGDLALARAGIWTEKQFLAHLAGEIEKLQNNPDRAVTSAEKASLVIWDRKDWPRVDYYNKGMLLGLLMDLRIRTASRGKKSLDDVLRHLYRTYCVVPGGPIGVGYPEDGILKALEAVTGEEWDDFYAQYVRGVDELPYANLMGPAGLDVAFHKVFVPDLGAELRGMDVCHMAAGGAAARAGIHEGDRIVAVDDFPVGRLTFYRKLAEAAGGETRLKLMREEEPMEVSLEVGLREEVSCKVERARNAAPKILESWLRSGVREQ